jgi:hypothetical protein
VTGFVSFLVVEDPTERSLVGFSNFLLPMRSMCKIKLMYQGGVDPGVDFNQMFEQRFDYSLQGLIKGSKFLVLKERELVELSTELKEIR